MRNLNNDFIQIRNFNNSARRYYERVQETGTYLDTVAASTDQPEPKTVQDFLDHIENQELYHVLITVDRITADCSDEDPGVQHS